MTTTIEREQYLDLLTQPTRVQLGTTKCLKLNMNCLKNI